MAIKQEPKMANCKNKNNLRNHLHASYQHRIPRRKHEKKKTDFWNAEIHVKCPNALALASWKGLGTPSFSGVITKPDSTSDQLPCPKCILNETRDCSYIRPYSQDFATALPKRSTKNTSQDGSCKIRAGNRNCSDAPTSALSEAWRLKKCRSLKRPQHSSGRLCLALSAPGTRLT